MSMLRFRLQLLTSRARLCQNISWIQFAINFIHPQDTMPNRIFDVCLHGQKPHDPRGRTPLRAGQPDRLLCVFLATGLSTRLVD